MDESDALKQSHRSVGNGSAGFKDITASERSSSGVLSHGSGCDSGVQARCALREPGAFRGHVQPTGLELPGLLDRIDHERPESKPVIQSTMNRTLVGIDIHDAKLRKRAIAIGDNSGLYRYWPVSKGGAPPSASPHDRCLSAPS